MRTEGPRRRFRCLHSLLAVRDREEVSTIRVGQVFPKLRTTLHQLRTHGGETFGCGFISHPRGSWPRRRPVFSRPWVVSRPASRSWSGHSHAGRRCEATERKP